MKRLITILILAGVLALTACTGGSSSSVEFPLLDGETVTLDELEGEIVVLNFWATWCAPCDIEMPTLQAFYDEHGGDYQMLGVNIGETAETASAYIEDREITFPIVLDPDGELYDYYGITGQPTTIVLDRNGEEIHRHVGLIVEQQLDEAILPLLEG